jgi:hypothetical protein
VQLCWGLLSTPHTTASNNFETVRVITQELVHCALRYFDSVRVYLKPFFPYLCRARPGISAVSPIRQVLLVSTLGNVWQVLWIRGFDRMAPYSTW